MNNSAENVVSLPLKCPLCRGRGKFDAVWPFDPEPCTFCHGTGKRPTDEEIEQRRAQQ